MEYFTTIIDGAFSGLIFLIKFGICFYIYKMVRENANQSKFDGKATRQIYFKELYILIIGSLILTIIQYANDGYDCIGGDPLYGGCDYYDYDENFVPLLFIDAIKIFSTYLIIVLVIGYYGIKKGIEDASFNLQFKSEQNRNFLNLK